MSAALLPIFYPFTYLISYRDRPGRRGIAACTPECSAWPAASTCPRAGRSAGPRRTPTSRPCPTGHWASHSPAAARSGRRRRPSPAAGGGRGAPATGSASGSRRATRPRTGARPWLTARGSCPP